MESVAEISFSEIASTPYQMRGAEQSVRKKVRSFFKDRKKQNWQIISSVNKFSIFGFFWSANIYL